MPRLADEGVVGADAIFACLGPALEIFSRYSRVEKASGDAVPLREYLEQVWAAVSTEALSMIFEGADAASLEPDARLTAMWLWTLGAGVGDSNGNGADDKVTASTGYSLWKVLCINTRLRVVFGYQRTWEDVGKLVQELEREVVGSLSTTEITSLPGETVVIMGSRGEGETFPWGYFRYWILNRSLGRFEKA